MFQKYSTKLLFFFVPILSVTTISFLVFSKNNENIFSPSILACLWNIVGESSPSEQTAETQQEGELPKDDSGFKYENGRYTNQKYGFSFNLPSVYTPRLQSYGESANVLTFDAGGEKSFQIFIMEHDEPAITPERIKIDVPDIVMQNIRTGTLDGMEVLVFNSSESSLGETYEVWFIHNGNLYQIMAYKDGERELNEVLDSWEFQ